MEATARRKARKPYESDLSDAEWAILQPLLPPAIAAGAPRTTDLREVINGILYRLHNGCAWHALPHDLPAEGTVRDYFHRWRRCGLWERINDTLRGRCAVPRVTTRSPPPASSTASRPKGAAP